MPLYGEGHSDLVRDEAPYFESLAQLDAWSTQPHNKLSGVVPYQPRPYIEGRSDSGGKLLVCHDYKVSGSLAYDSITVMRGQPVRDPRLNTTIGGYAEYPSGLCYTFNFWRLCDTFVYFSHHRVTVPPSGWINTAHKHGTMILGTLIFEGHGNPDCVQLLVGHAGFVVTNHQIPISNRYAVLLAELACQRGFDGYLLNFEADLEHETDHAHALTAWILLLKAALRDKVGPHAQVVWYDSVIYNGRVRYQNRLNGYNLPFFLASDAFFTNYWWRPETQTSMIEYFANLKTAVPDPSSSTDVPSPAATKILQDIYSGVDVFPRRGGIFQYGCGYTCYCAINHTGPRGFSTALFAPGWTWEGETKNPEENWDEWWRNERKLWLGPLKPGEIIQVPGSLEGPFKPMTAFFQNLSLPNPSELVFYTHFSPGIGYSWFVRGSKVLDTKKGWTDIDKQSSIGDLVWPWPTPSWEGDRQDETDLTASTAFDMTDGYNGGNALKLTIACAGINVETIAKAIWLPVQSLVVTAQQSFEAHVTYKSTAPDDVDITPRIHVQSLLEGEIDTIVYTVGEVILTDLPNGWTSQTIHFTSSSTRNTVSVAIGFLTDIIPRDPFVSTVFTLSLGQLAVYPTPPPQFVSVGTPCITNAKFSPRPRETNTDTLEGVLTWDTASTLTPIDAQLDDPESITPVWLLHDTPAYRFPAFVYFNVYVAPLDASTQADPDSAVFVGTTGLDGRANRFYVEPACLPFSLDGWAGIRFYVQGVTDRGEVLPWEKCAIVDHRKSKV